MALTFGYARYLCGRDRLPPPRGVKLFGKGRRRKETTDREGEKETEKERTSQSGIRMGRMKGRGETHHTRKGLSAWAKRDALVSRLRGRVQTRWKGSGLAERGREGAVSPGQTRGGRMAGEGGLERQLRKLRRRRICE